MKRLLYTILTFLLCVIIPISVLPVSAVNSDTAGSELERLSAAIFDKGISSSSLDGYERSTADWYIMAMSQTGQIKNGQIYADSLDKYLENNKDINVTEQTRIALTYVALGVENEFVNKIADTDISKSGITAKIFMAVLNYNLQRERADLLASDIISLQNADGGWSLVEGKASEVDLTAMAVCALSFEKTLYSKEIEAALAFLSEHQGKSGAFASFGVENAESTSQVIVALTSCGIDPCTDTRFIKNENTPFDALLRFRTDSGEYSHTVGGNNNQIATVQTYIALVSMVKFTLCETGFYDFGTKCDPLISQNTSTSSLSFGTVFKIVAMSCIAATALVSVIYMAIRRKSVKAVIVNSAVILCVSTVLSVFIFNLDIKTPEEYYSQKPPATGKQITVTVTINCSNAIGKTDNPYLPYDGAILTNYEITVSEGFSAYDAIVAACRDNKILIDGGVYIRGINHLYEKDCGELSGWMYCVNQEFPGISSDSYTLADGDDLLFAYTCDMGEDLK